MEAEDVVSIERIVRSFGGLRKYSHQCHGSRLCAMGRVPYPNRVIRRRRIAHFLRTSLLVLLALGVMIKPVLAEIGELHSAEHELSMAAVDHGAHHHGDHDEHGGPDHAQGQHGLMHQGGAGQPVGIAMSSIALPPMHFGRVILPPLHATPLPRQTATTPFRPPIA